MSTLSSLIVLATEGGIPADSPLAKLAVPIGIVIFVGSVYLLLRSNLGTRLGYLVMSTSLWGATFLFALFWTFGAPGTPAFTGPQNLPGQQLDEYLPIWVPLAQDASAVTEEGSPYAVIAGYPDGFDDTPTTDADNVDTAIADISAFFSGLSDPYTPLLSGLEEPVATEFAEADNGRPIVAVTFARTCQLDNDGNLSAACEELGAGAVAPEGSEDRGEDVTLFAFFDAGNPAFPSYLMLAGTFVLFAGHMVLLARDEKRTAAEQVEAAAEDAEVEPKATVPA